MRDLAGRGPSPQRWRHRAAAAQAARIALEDGHGIEQSARSNEAMQAAQAHLDELFSDAVKSIACRAETATVVLLRRHLANKDEARALVRELFVSAADIEPNDPAKTPTIRVHRMADPSHEKAAAALFNDLNGQDFCRPETGARMIYALV